MVVKWRKSCIFFNQTDFSFILKSFYVSNSLDMVENLGQRHNACPPVYPISILGSFGTAMGPTRIHVQTLPIYSGYVRQCQYIQSDPNCPRQVSIFQNHYEVNFLPFTQMFKNGFCLVYPFNIARCIANSICLVACKLKLHCTWQILNE